MVYQNYSIMPRTFRNRVHSLLPLAQQHKHPLHLALSFCLHSDKPPGKPSSSCSSCLQAPAFNKDSNYASPAFVLPCDQEYYRLRGADMLCEHDLRFRGYTDEKTELMVVRPRGRSSYCNVCRVYYQDYLQHIGGKGHKYKVQTAEFTQHILELKTVLEAVRAREKEEKGSSSAGEKGEKEGSSVREKEGSSAREKEGSSVRETSVRASSVDENGEREEWELEGLPVKKVKTNQVLQDSHGMGSQPGSGLSNRNVGTNMAMTINNTNNINSNNINSSNINSNKNMNSYVNSIIKQSINTSNPYISTHNHSIFPQVASSRAIEEQLMQEERGRLIRMQSYQLQQLALSLNISTSILMSTLNCQSLTLGTPYSSLHPLGPVTIPAPVAYSGYSPFPSVPHALYTHYDPPYASSAVGKMGYGYQKGQF